MKTSVRSYNYNSDFDRVGEFLVRTYAAAGNHINWLQPRWEYMHFHPLIKGVDLSSIGIWEAGGEIVGVVHPEHPLSPAYFEVDPSWSVLKEEMLAYAEETLPAVKDGSKVLTILINDRDREFQEMAAKRGYRKLEIDTVNQAGFEAMMRFVISKPFPAIRLPDGFQLMSLDDDNDLRKLSRVLWRGFDHGDNPPDDGLEERRFMQSAPNYNKGLNIVVKAPNGDFASYSGTWYEPVNRIAYVEPVATDPDYRRMGLASAAVLEGVRRCGLLGAAAAYVGSSRPLYLSLGFKRIYTSSTWQREWK